MSALTLPAADAPAQEWGRLAMRIPGWCEPPWDLPSSWLASFHDLVPDPDHWAWEGWFLRLLGDRLLGVFRRGDEWVVRINGYAADHAGSTLGRACIAAAAALRRWPGSEE